MVRVLRTAQKIGVGTRFVLRGASAVAHILSDVPLQRVRCRSDVHCRGEQTVSLQTVDAQLEQCTRRTRPISRNLANSVLRSSDGMV
jgi:hypothetical protein